MNPSDHDPLRGVLKQWTGQNEVPPGFQREVWRRIEARQRTSLQGWLEALIERWSAVPAPALAAALVALTLTSVLAGNLSVRARADETKAAMANAYYASIDPVARTAQP